MARSRDVAVLLPYLNRYLNNGEFPNGKGMMYQTVALINVFEVVSAIFRKYEKEDFDRKMKNK